MSLSGTRPPLTRPGRREPRPLKRLFDRREALLARLAEEYRDARDYRDARAGRADEAHTHTGRGVLPQPPC